MPRFRAPSSSVASSDAPAKNTRSQSKKTRVTSRRARAHKLDRTRVAVKDAAKRAFKAMQLVEPCVAYVGNIGPDVDEDALTAYFGRYGRILSAQIHCCGGVAMTTRPPPPSYHQNMRVRQYAMIVFASKAARHAACKGEHTLKGNCLVVSVVVSDLPEVQEKISNRLDDYRSRLEPLDAHRAQQSAVRSLMLEPTVLLDPLYEKKGKQRKRFEVMGVSFEGCVA